MKRGFYAQRRDGRKTISHFYEVYTKDNPEKIVGGWKNPPANGGTLRSEERRVGKECRL